jgi:hypothetical protein
MRVMPIWTVERNRPGSSASASAACAPGRPISAMALSLTRLEETMASSESANTPFRRIRTTATTISIKSLRETVLASRERHSPPGQGSEVDPERLPFQVPDPCQIAYAASQTAISTCSSFPDEHRMWGREMNNDVQQRPKVRDGRLRAGRIGCGQRRGLARVHRGQGVTRRVPFCDREASSPIFEPCRAAPGPSSPTAARARFCAHDLGRKVTENEKIKLGEANSGPSQPVFTPDGTMARPLALPDRRCELRFRRLDRALG